MLSRGGQGRQRAVSEILRGDTGVPAFEALAAGMRAQGQLQSELKATLAEPALVTRSGPLFSGGGKRR